MSGLLLGEGIEELLGFGVAALLGEASVDDGGARAVEFGEEACGAER